MASDKEYRGVICAVFHNVRKWHSILPDGRVLFQKWSGDGILGSCGHRMGVDWRITAKGRGDGYRGIGGEHSVGVGEFGLVSNIRMALNLAR